MEAIIWNLNSRRSPEEKDFGRMKLHLVQSKCISLLKHCKSGPCLTNFPQDQDEFMPQNKEHILVNFIQPSLTFF